CAPWVPMTCAASNPPHVMSSLPRLPRTVRPRRVERTHAARARRATVRRSRLQHAVVSALGIVAVAVAAGVSVIMLLTAAVIADGGTPTRDGQRPAVVAIDDITPMPAAGAAVAP
ncbi:MAG: hypothetical protein ACO3C1_01245, partial [Ilumatobacteraceae bacterium]